jgi:crotonobetainyl-CoA:carnitine CoA-transferase CaiB-like acyl-CoA transferase
VPERKTRKKEHKHSCKSAPHNSKDAESQQTKDTIMRTENTTTTDNIFSGLKVVNLSSFVAGPGAAVILSDFGADVIKVEPPKGELWRIGNKIPPQPLSKVPYMWHLNNRNKRGITLDLKSSDAVKVLERLAKWADVFIVNTPHPAREKLKLSYDDVAQWNSRMIYADITGYGDTGPDAALPGFDITAYWSRSGLLSLTHDAGAPPTWPFAGTGDAPSGVGLFAAIVTALYRRERTGKGSYVTTSLLAAGVWSAGVAIQAALAGAKFSPQHDRKNPANAAMNVYKSSDDVWFVLVTTPDKIPVLATGIGRADLLKDPRFADPAKLAANMRQLTAIVDETFSSQPMAHWREVLDKAHIPYGLVRDPIEAIKDPQLQANNIIVPLEGAGENMKLTVSSPIQVHGVAKVAAKRGPDLGEHNDEVLEQLGFDVKEIERLRASGVIAKPAAPAAAASRRTAVAA